MQPLKLDDVQRILVLNRNHIGDCLLTTPLLRAIKRRFPRAHLAVSVPTSNAELLSTNPHVDEIVPRPEIKRWGQKVRFGVSIRRGKYDLIISLQEKSTFYGYASAYSALLNPHKTVTVCLDHPRTRRYYSHVVPIPPDQHEVHKYLQIAALLGCPKEKRPVLELTPTPRARKGAQRFLEARGMDDAARFIGINPGATTGGKRWPAARFAEVADRLHEASGLPALVFGGPEDSERASEILSTMRSHRPLIAAGKTTLGETAALLERCHLLVTNDTGPMHMAVALAVPVVALFGPTSHVKFGPFTTLKTVLRHDQPCPECLRPCIHAIEVDECVEAALRLNPPPPRAQGLEPVHS